MNNEKLLTLANESGARWLSVVNFSGKSDKKKIYEVLAARTHNGKRVKTVKVVDSLSEAYKYLVSLHKRSNAENKKAIEQSYNCIWDYYMMAFYESAYQCLPNKDFEGSEFIRQSLFPAFEVGLGFVICLGELLVGVCLPEAHRDDQLRLHREDGAAIIWGKKKSYFWHGTEIPVEWMKNKDKINPALCLTHPNIEQRRALCEMIGWEKVIVQLSAKIIQKDSFGDLLEVNLPDAGMTRFVRVLCPTGRTFCLPVTLEVKTAHEAVALTYNIPIQEYNPEART